MSVPSSIPSSDGPTVTKTRLSDLEVVGSSIVNPLGDLTTQSDDLMTSSDNDRGLAEQSREAREDFIRTISRLKEESQPSLAYLEEFQYNPDKSAPVLESLVIPDFSGIAYFIVFNIKSIGSRMVHLVWLSRVPYHFSSPGQFYFVFLKY